MTTIPSDPALSMDSPWLSSDRPMIGPWPVIVYTADRSDKADTDIYFAEIKLDGYPSVYHRYPICTADGDQSNPSISGDKVVWQDERNGNSDIYLYDLTTRTEQSVCVAPGDQSHPAISGDTVVWFDARDGGSLRVRDLGAGTERVLSSGIPECEPSISGRYVVVTAPTTDISSYGDDVRVYDLNNTFVSYNNVPGLPDAARSEASVSGSVIAWCETSPSHPTRILITGFRDLGDLSAPGNNAWSGSVSANTDDCHNPSLSGDLMAYQRGGDIYLRYNDTVDDYLLFGRMDGLDQVTEPLATSIVSGSVQEDLSNDIYPGLNWEPLGLIKPYVSLDHFWDGDEGCGALNKNLMSTIRVFPNAWQKASRLWRSAIDRWQDNDLYGAYFLLGHVAHKVQDETLAAHVHQDYHPSVALFGAELGDYDPFETWMKGQFAPSAWSYNPASGGQWPGPIVRPPSDTSIVSDLVAWGDKRWSNADYIYPLDSGTAWLYAHGYPWVSTTLDMRYEASNADPCYKMPQLFYLMYTASQVGDFFASDDYNGDNTDELGWVSYADTTAFPARLEDQGALLNNGGTIVGQPSAPNDLDGDLSRLRDTCYRYAARDTAGLYELFRWTCDHVAPTSQVSFAGAQLQPSSGWYTGPVTVQMTGATDAGNPSNGGRTFRAAGVYDDPTWGPVWGVCDGVANGQWRLSAQGIHVLRSRTMDVLGNQEQRTWDIKIDSAAPVSQASGQDDHWYNQDVSVTLSAQDYVPTGLALDQVSGLAEIRYSLDGSTPQQYSAPVTVSGEGAHTLSYWSVDAAGNAESSKTRMIHIDMTPPRITVTKPAKDAQYVLGQNVTAAWTAVDDLSGVASSSSTPVDNGTLLPTNSFGAKSFHVVATDQAGNVATSDVAYSVPYAVSNLLQPIASDGSSIFKLGRGCVPLKLKITNSTGTAVSTLAPTLRLVKVANGAPYGDEYDPASTSSPTSGDAFRFDAASGQYIYNLAASNLVKLGLPTSGVTYAVKVILPNGGEVISQTFALQ